jgi:hypothetical protein
MFMYWQPSLDFLEGLQRAKVVRFRSIFALSRQLGRDITIPEPAYHFLQSYFCIHATYDNNRLIPMMLSSGNAVHQVSSAKDGCWGLTELKPETSRDAVSPK